MELAEKHHLGRKLRRSWLVSYVLSNLSSGYAFVWNFNRISSENTITYPYTQFIFSLQKTANVPARIKPVF